MRFSIGESGACVARRQTASPIVDRVLAVDREVRVEGDALERVHGTAA
jgi:hypothetical protein